MTIMMAFRSFTVATTLALLALLVYAGQPGVLWWWAGALPFAVWVMGPVAAPYLLAARQSRRWFSITMLVFFAASSSFSGLIYYDAFVRSKSSTAALVMVFVPLYQWFALVALLFVWWAAEWLTRRDKAA